jgi:hypothetical protein
VATGWVQSTGGPVQSHVYASGGAGGQVSSATARSTAVSQALGATGTAIAVASASGGGQPGTTFLGNANAYASATTANGQFAIAQANAHGGQALAQSGAATSFRNVAATATATASAGTAPVGSRSQAQGGTIFGLDTWNNAYAFVTARPSPAQAATALAGQPALQAAFGASPTWIGAGAEGALSPGVSESVLDFTVGPGLKLGGDIILGFTGLQLSGAGFDQLTFTEQMTKVGKLVDITLTFDAVITGAGNGFGLSELIGDPTGSGTLIGPSFSQTFTSPGAFLAFAGQALNLGPAPGGVGGVPEPGTWALMLMGVGFCGAALRRRRAHVG